MRPARVVLIVFGAIAALIGLVLTAGGGVVTWAYATQRDGDGYFTTSTEQLRTPASALASDPVLLGEAGRGGDWRHDWGDLVTVRFRVEAPDEKPVFVGVGPEDEVDAWMAGTSHAVVTDIDFDPFDPTYDVRRGERAPAAPGDQKFWVTSSTGPGERTIEWDLEDGEWVVVVMNADRTRGVTIDASVGAKSDLVLPIAIGLLVAGGVALLVGTGMIVLGALWRRETAAPTAGATVPPGAVYPVRVDAASVPETSRWLWLVKWFLLIPHYVVLFFLWIAFGVTTVVAGFAILFTGRYPRSLFEFNVGVLRWTWRVHFYGYGANGTDAYPPFTLSEVADHPARIDVAYPERLSRGLVLVKWWLLAIPHYLIVGVFTGGALLGWRAWGARGEWTWGGGGLIGLLVLFAAVVRLFGRRYPQGIYDFVIGMNRWAFRVLAYAALMRDEYPPFRMDGGGDEPAPPGDSPTGPGGPVAEPQPAGDPLVPA